MDGERGDVLRRTGSGVFLFLLCVYCTRNIPLSDFSAGCRRNGTNAMEISTIYLVVNTSAGVDEAEDWSFVEGRMMYTTCEFR